MLAPNPPDRLHRQHSLTARSKPKRTAIRSDFRGSILDADPPAQGVKIARRMTLTVGVDHRQPRGRRQRHNLSALTDKQPIGWHHHQFDMLTRQSLERSIEIARPMGLGPYKLERECAGSGLEVSPVDHIRLIAGMYQHTDLLRARQYLEREFNLLRGQIVR